MTKEECAEEAAAYVREKVAERGWTREIEARGLLLHCLRQPGMREGKYRDRNYAQAH